MTGTAPIQIKGITVSTVAINFFVDDLSALEVYLTQKFGQKASFFEGEPTILDLEQVPNLTDISALVDLIRRFGLVPVALRHANVTQAVAGKGLNMALLESDEPNGSPSTDRTLEAEAAEVIAPNLSEGEMDFQTSLPFDRADKVFVETKRTRRTPKQIEVTVSTELPETGKVPEPAIKPAGADGASSEISVNCPAMVVSKPLRSGQQVYAKGCDLIILAPVSFGAEVMADGNIHVYSTLRGRALAGVRGDRSARIYALAMQAELVSIAGVYRLFEEGLPKALRDRPVAVTLNDSDQITVALIDP